MSEDMFLVEMGKIPTVVFWGKRVVVKIDPDTVGSYGKIIDPIGLSGTIIQLCGQMNNWILCEGPSRVLTTVEYEALVSPYIAIQQVFTEEKLGDFLEKLKEFGIAYGALFKQFRNRTLELEHLLQEVKKYAISARWQVFSTLVEADKTEFP